MKELVEMAFSDFERGEPAKGIVEEMQTRLADQFGVTVVDPYVTVRWRKGKSLVQVSMLVVSITDSSWVESRDTENK